MGRKKKNLETSSNSSRSRSRSKSTKESRQFKKWWGIWNTSLKKQLSYEEEVFNDKINEKFRSDQEVKNIINELYIQIKNCDYYVKKQWHTLKKFNRQEKIHREESMIIMNNQKQKKNQYLTEAIEKLTACHVTGFEPWSVIRKKILNKLQLKYQISEPDIQRLSQKFEVECNDEEEGKKRKELQLSALRQITSNHSLFEYREVDQNTYFTAKNDIKKYEKELEAKAKLNDLGDVSVGMGLDPEDRFGHKQNENEEFPGGEESNQITKEKMNEEEEQVKIKLSDFMNDNWTVGFFKKKKNEVIDNLKNEILQEKQNGTFSLSEKEYKSEILNDLNKKIKMNGTLSDFDMMILLYMYHSIANEINSSKNTRKEYSLFLQPTEWLSFLKDNKIELDKENKSE